MEDLSYLEATEIKESDLQELAPKIRALQTVRKKIKDLEEELKAVKDIEKRLSGEEIPQFLSKFALSKLTLEDGSSLEVKEEIYVSLPKTDLIKRKKVMNWIIQHGGEGLVKDKVTIEDPGDTVLIALNNLECPYERKKDIHSQTLKAFFKNILGLKKNTIQQVELSEVPKEANLFIYKETKLK
jgi:hypothetical protein